MTHATLPSCCLGRFNLARNLPAFLFFCYLACFTSRICQRRPGQCNTRQQAALRAGQEFQLAVVVAGNSFDDGQSQAGAGAVAAGGFEAGEGEFEAFDFAGGNAWPPVADFDQQLLTGRCSRSCLCSVFRHAQA